MQDDPTSVCTCKGYVYFIENRERRLVKIGYSASVSDRHKALDSKSGILRLIGYLPGTKHTEAWLHDKFNIERASGEWFIYSPRLREFIKQVGLIGGPSPKVPRYARGSDPAAETATTDPALVEALMQIARTEVRRYLYSIIETAVPEWRRLRAREQGLRAIDVARANGSRIGRPNRAIDLDRAAALRASGLSWRQLGAELGCSHQTVRMQLARRQKGVPKPSRPG